MRVPVTDVFLQGWKPPARGRSEITDTTRGRIGLVWRQTKAGEITVCGSLTPIFFLK